MAIAFNLPSEREAAEENFSRLNRLIAELYEVLCHILVTRPPGQEAHENRRDRPSSESDAEASGSTAQVHSQQCRLSASSPPLTFSWNQEVGNAVFVGPRADIGNDLFAIRRLDIFGNGSHRMSMPMRRVLLRRETTFTFSLTSEKHRCDKGGTDMADGVHSDETDAAEGESELPSIEPSSQWAALLSIMPDKVSGSICTAIILMLGWKIWSQR